MTDPRAATVAAAGARPNDVPTDPAPDAPDAPGVSEAPAEGAPCPGCGTLADSDQPCPACKRPALDPRVGEVVAGKYRIEALLGAGGMGRVYRATHLELGEPVAVKFLLAEWAARAEMRARFRREAVVLARLRHPNIVSIVDYGEHVGDAFLVMELVRGESLASQVRAGGLTMPLPRVVAVVDQVLQVLEAAHAAGVVLRDLKPENVMLLDAGDRTDRVKVLDFGIAFLDAGAGAPRLTAANTVHGTPQYMSPEQCVGRDIGPASDVYAVGVILYEMLVGSPPFEGRSSAEVISQQMFGTAPSFAERPPPREVPLGVETLVLRALEAPRAPAHGRGVPRRPRALREGPRRGLGLGERRRRARVAGLSREDRALAPDHDPLPEGPANVAGPTPRVALWGFDEARANALRAAMAAQGVQACVVPRGRHARTRRADASGKPGRHAGDVFRPRVRARRGQLPGPARRGRARRGRAHAAPRVSALTLREGTEEARDARCAGAGDHVQAVAVETAIEKARVLLEALPYIRRFQGRTFVIKYGGHAMVAPELKDSFARDVCLLKYIGVNVVVVHGGGPQISAALQRSGVQSRFVDGLRVTDDAAMDVVEMVLAGSINSDIVSLICRHGGRAVGLSGKDDGFVLADKSPPMRARDGEEVDMGRVGEVRHVTPDVVVELMRAGFIPVIAPIGVDTNGASLNLNADTAAGKVAEALRAEKLILLTDVEGVRGADGSFLSSLTSTVARELIAQRVIDGGMIPKVECALDAIDGGVRKVHVIDGRKSHAVLLEIFTDGGVGTEITRNK